MSRYLKVDKTTIIIKAEYHYYRVKIPGEYHDIYGHLCSRCCVSESQISSLYCDMLRIDENSKFLCSSLCRIGYESNYIRSVRPFTMSLFINSLLTKLIKDYEETRFNEIEVRE